MLVPPTHFTFAGNRNRSQLCPMRVLWNVVVNVTVCEITTMRSPACGTSSQPWLQLELPEKSIKKMSHPLDFGVTE